MARRKEYVPRVDGPGSGRRAAPRGHAHRPHVITNGSWDDASTCCWVAREQCRCGAFRVRVFVAANRVQFTEWLAPCSDPSPAPARDEAAR